MHIFIVYTSACVYICGCCLCTCIGPLKWQHHACDTQEKIFFLLCLTLWPHHSGTTPLSSNQNPRQSRARRPKVTSLCNHYVLLLTFFIDFSEITQSEGRRRHTVQIQGVHFIIQGITLSVTKAITKTVWSPVANAGSPLHLPRLNCLERVSPIRKLGEWLDKMDSLSRAQSDEHCDVVVRRCLHNGDS